MVSAWNPQLQIQKANQSNVKLAPQKPKKKLTIFINSIPPPIQIDRAPLRELQRKKDSNQTQHRPTIQRRTRHIIEFTPPLEVALADKVLEDEPDEEPWGVVDSGRRRDERHPIEDDGRRDVPEPVWSVWVPALP